MRRRRIIIAKALQLLVLVGIGGILAGQLYVLKELVDHLKSQAADEKTLGRLADKLDRQGEETAAAQEELSKEV